MTEETLFTKIINGDLPSDMVYQDETVSAFRDIQPRRPVHILIVPNKPIPSVNEVEPEDESVLGHMFIIARKLAEQENIAERGYRLIVNCGDEGHQEVPHLHMHLVGGSDTGPMLVKDKS